MDIVEPQQIENISSQIITTKQDEDKNLMKTIKEQVQNEIPKEIIKKQEEPISDSIIKSSINDAIQNSLLELINLAKTTATSDIIEIDVREIKKSMTKNELENRRCKICKEIFKSKL